MGWDEIFKHEFFKGVRRTNQNTSQKPQGTNLNGSDSSGEKVYYGEHKEIYKQAESINEFNETHMNPHYNPPL